MLDFCQHVVDQHGHEASALGFHHFYFVQNLVAGIEKQLISFYLQNLDRNFIKVAI